MRSSERGVNSILTTILRFWPTSWKDRTFCFFAWWHPFSARWEDHFQKKLSKTWTDLPFRFCKIGLRNTLFIFGRKNGRLLFCFVCGNFVRFWLTFKKLKYLLIELRKMLIKKNVFYVRRCLGIAQPLRWFCRFTGFTKMQLT